LASDINSVGAHVLASLVADDINAIKAYVAAHPVEYELFLAAENERESQVNTDALPKKQRQSRKSLDMVVVK